MRVYDRGEDDGRLWIAMEYVEGRDLGDVLAGRRPAAGGAGDGLLERIAAGLDAIHARGLLHRDVKPANILVTRDVLGIERALLTDFGIARSAADSLGLTGVGDIVATLHYAAPEQFELRSGELDRRVDVYALGCVLYEMLTGRVPLQGDSVAAFWHVMQSKETPPPSRYWPPASPPQLDAVLAKALGKSRDDRYGSAGELARAARAAITSAAAGYSQPTYTPSTGPQPTVTAQQYQAPYQAPYPPPRQSPPASQKKRRGLLIGSLAALVVAAAVAVTLVLALGNKKDVPGVPTALKATPGRGTVTLSWQPGSGKTDHYAVFRDGQAVSTSVTATSYVDRIANTQAHRFAVQAINAKGTSSELSPAVQAAAQIRELNSKEQALVAKLPTSLVDDSSCQPLPTALNANVTVAVTCDPAPGQTPTAPGKVPQVVEVYMAPSNTQLRAALSDEITRHGAKSGDCSRTPQEGTWNFTETPKVTNGQLVCYVTSSTSYLLWSYTSQSFYIRISTSATYQSLLSYWQDAALHLP